MLRHFILVNDKVVSDLTSRFSSMEQGRLLIPIVLDVLVEGAYRTLRSQVDSKLGVAMFHRLLLLK